MENKIKKHDSVELKNYPGSNLIDWKIGIVQKLSMDEDEALISTVDNLGKERRFWEYIDNLKLVTNE